MRWWQLVWRSAWHDRRRQLALAVSVTVATAVLIGALCVGDSMRASLARLQSQRLGGVHLAWEGRDRFLRATLAAAVRADLAQPTTAAIALPGTVATPTGSIQPVRLYGVEPRFFDFWDGPRTIPPDAVLLGRPVAERLRLAVGDFVVLRWERPSTMPLAAALTPTADRIIGARLRVAGVLGPDQGGHFSLRANQATAWNVFVDREWLAERLGRTGQANLLLTAAAETAAVQASLKRHGRLEDLALRWQPLPDGRWQLDSPRVFLPDAVVRAARHAAAAQAVQTLFVETLAHGDRRCPYSTVTALDPGDPRLDPLGPNEIAITDWLAQDLAAGVGDTVAIQYWRLGAGRRLRSESRVFTVRQVVPLANGPSDPNLMPPLEGLSDAERCTDWKAGIALDYDRIRPRDELYWQRYRGSPKAFVSWQTGQEMGANPFGRVTGLRFGESPQTLARRLWDDIDPVEVGWTWQPVAEWGRRARQQAIDFGGLFLGLSLFVIAGALILVALQFGFLLDGRRPQIGTLRALGWPWPRVRRVVWLEAMAVSLLGTGGGIPLGVLTGWALIGALRHWWPDAVARSSVWFAVRPGSLAVGVLAALITTALALWASLRAQRRPDTVTLLHGELEPADTPDVSLGRAWTWAIAFGLPGGIACALTRCVAPETAQGLALAGGAALLAGFVLAVRALLLAGRRAGHGPARTLAGWAWRQACRQPRRSLSLVGLAGFAVFVVAVVGASRHGPVDDPARRDSGTGGFSLFGRLSVALLDDLNDPNTWSALGLPENLMRRMRWVPLRVHAGDEASCLNLNRPQQPAVWGVDPNELADRAAFRFIGSSVHSGHSGWTALGHTEDPNVVAVVADAATAKWALGLTVGEETSLLDEQGRPRRVRLVGTVQTSILQGALIMAAADFDRLFPADVGAAAFLIDCPQESVPEAVEVLSRRLMDHGLLLTSTVQRLAAFAAVENTYLAIFTVMGTLGLMIGSVGLACVVFRQTVERAGHWALMRALGWPLPRLAHLVIAEHALLWLLGLGCGTVSAFLAVLPSLLDRGAAGTLMGLWPTFGLTVLTGGLSLWPAAVVALRGVDLDVLRDE